MDVHKSLALLSTMNPSEALTNSKVDDLQSISIDNTLPDDLKLVNVEEKENIDLLSDLVDYKKKNLSIAEQIALNFKKIRDNSDYSSIESFDEFLSDNDTFSENENSELSNNLISLGRKYARETGVSGESSEITKTFSDSEKRLTELYNELDKDKKSLQQDIDRTRLPQRGNNKLLSDMVTAKNSMHNTQLSIVKEVNALRKLKYELKQKDAAKKELTAEKADMTPNLMQSILSSTRASMMEGMGGYSTTTPEDLNIYNDDEGIQKKYFSNVEETEGDLYLKYENRGVEYVVVLEDGKVNDVLAEDNEGNIIHDYPMPSNIGDLEFDIDMSTMTARDNLHRVYKVRM